MQRLSDFPDATRLPFLAGYQLGERETYELVNDEQQLAIRASRYSDARAFIDAVRLKVLVFYEGWADTVDFKRDEVEYALLATELNDRYGDFVRGQYEIEPGEQSPRRGVRGFSIKEDRVGWGSL